MDSFTMGCGATTSWKGRGSARIRVVRFIRELIRADSGKDAALSTLQRYILYRGIDTRAALILSVLGSDI